MFKLIDQKHCKDINANVKVYRYGETQCQVVKIKYNDVKLDEMSFGIGFNTPPKNNKGVQHIIEHSVLCGSKNYQTKEPFADLMKSSLQTYLNAFTMLDKTIYPVSTYNFEDFKNLIQVYVDAVFRPLFLDDKRIFHQEGWRYQVKDNNLNVTGIVFSEMQGNYSEPDVNISTLTRSVLNSDSYLQYDSGGKPSDIIELSYNEFVEYYKEHYCLNNSAIVLISQNSDDLELNFLQQILHGVSQGINRFERLFDSSKRINCQDVIYDKYQSDDDKNIVYFESKLFNYFDHSYSEVLELQIIDYLLFTSSASPIVQHFLKSNLCQSFSSSLDAGQQQLYYQFKFSGVDEENSEKVFKEFKAVLQDTLRSNYFSNESVQSVISRMKLESLIIGEEHNIEIIEKVCSAVLEGLSFDFELVDNDVFEQIENMGIESAIGMFKALTQEYILDNEDFVQVVLQPSKSFVSQKEREFRQKMQHIFSILPESEKKNICLLDTQVQDRQKQQDSAEAKLSIPSLSLRDCSSVIDNMNFLFGHFEDNIFYFDSDQEIVKVKLYFDVQQFVQNPIALGVVLQLITDVPTKKYDLSQLQLEIDTLTNGVDVTLVDRRYPDCIRFFVQVTFTCLEANFQKAVQLVNEIIVSSIYSNNKLAHGKFDELIQNLEEEMTSEQPYDFVTLRVQSVQNQTFAFHDKVQGLEFYQQLKTIVANGGSVVLLKQCEELSKSITASFAAISTKVDIFTKIKNQIVQQFPFIQKSQYSEQQSSLKAAHFKIPQQVNYVAKAISYQKFEPLTLLMNKIIETNYLWDEIRVLGGAYGVQIAANNDNQLYVSTYRDPNIQSSLDTIDNIYIFVNQLQISEQDLIKFKIACIGQRQCRQSPSFMFAKAVSLFLDNISIQEYKERFFTIIKANIADLKALSSLYAQFKNNEPVIAEGGLDEESSENDDESDVNC